MDEVCQDALDQEVCEKYKAQGMCQRTNDNLFDFCKSTCDLCGTPVLLSSLFNTGYQLACEKLCDAYIFTFLYSNRSGVV